MINDDTIKKTICKNITKYRKLAGLSQKEFAKKLGAAPSRVSSWETGANSTDIDTLFRICDILDVSINDMCGIYPDANILLSYLEQEHIKKYRALDPHGQETVSYILDRESDRVKKYGKLSERGIINLIEVSPTTDISKVIPYWKEGAAAGSGIYQLNDTESVPMKLFVTSITRQADFIIKVSGESMSPDYHDGDKVLVSQKAVVQLGEVGIFVKNGSSYIKEMGTMELISRNPDYPNIPVNDFDNVVCLGKVIGKVTDDMIVHD